MVYLNWIGNFKCDYFMSFFVVDVNFFVLSLLRDIIEKFFYFQIFMRQEFQIYVKIFCGKNMVWMFDIQRYDDLSLSIVSECKEWFVKRMYVWEFV